MSHATRFIGDSEVATNKLKRSLRSKAGGPYKRVQKMYCEDVFFLAD